MAEYWYADLIRNEVGEAEIVDHGTREQWCSGVEDSHGVILASCVEGAWYWEDFIEGDKIPPEDYLFAATVGLCPLDREIPDHLRYGAVAGDYGPQRRSPNPLP